LVPVAKGGIEEIDASVGHGSAPSARRMLGWFMATRTPSSRAAGGSAAIHAHGAAATGLDCRVGFGSSRYRLRVAQRLSGCRAWEATSSTPPPGGAAGPVLEVNPLCQQLVANVVGGGEIAVPARLDPPGDHRLDFVIGQAAGPRPTFQPRFRIPLEKAEQCATRHQR